MLRCPFRPARPAARLLLAGAVVLVSACSGPSSSYDAVDLDGLEQGPCAPAVDAMEQVDADLRALADDEVAPDPVAERFSSVQDELAEAQVGPDAGPAVTELVTSLGFFRVAVDSTTYDDDDAARVRTALAGLADACR